MFNIKSKLEEVYDRYKRLEAELMRPDVASDMKKYRKLTQEYANLKEISEKYKDWERVESELAGQKQMLRDENDPELIGLIKEEIPMLEEKFEKLTDELQVLLLPKDPLDSKSAVLEIRAGTGGDEASLFAAEIYRMYTRYADFKGWKIETVSISEQEGGGLKEVVAFVHGNGVYGRLRYESGVHRVQRVPETESQGRVHTSAITVAVMPEVDDVDEVKIDDKDLRIDVYRASGSGGQHINKTESAVRITHIPSGIVVATQDGRSQIQNREKAMNILYAKLLQFEVDKHNSEISEQRKSLVGSGDRSEKIRTYNFPQSRVTDHRIGLTLYRIDDVMQGALDLVIEPLLTWQNAELLKNSLSSE